MLINWILWILAAVIEAMLVTLLLMQKRMIERARRMIGEVGAIARSGDMSVRLQPDGVDELSNLARSINELMATVENSRQALRESEEKYRKITENLTVGVTLLTAEGKVLATNPQMKKWFPEKPGAEFADPVAACGAGEDPCKKCLADGITHEGMMRIRTAAGLRDFRATACPILGNRGEVASVVRLLEDETERLRLQEHMQQAKRLEAVGTLAAGVAHEINNPLNNLELTVSGLELLLERREPSAERDEVLARLRKATGEVGRIGEIVAHMRSLVRHKKTDVISPVDVNACVEQALKLLRAQLSVHQIKLQLLLSPGLQPRRGDSHQLEQVVIHLVTNAMQALDKSRVREKRILVRTESCPDKVVLTVEDNGPGLGSDADRVFDPFFTTKEAGAGMGLGLSIVYSTVTGWGGEVEAFDKSEGGAVFRITLKE
jgi:C4-dicarboxylate-specific signal transduction histidine kinase